MPGWAYFVVGFIMLALVLLTFRRNTTVKHTTRAEYGGDFGGVLDEVDPAMEALREAVREGQERPVAMSAARARSRVKDAIATLDRLEVPASLADEEWSELEQLRVSLRQAMENYEWAARIAETTDLIENAGLRRGFDALVAAGDQLAVECRLQLVALRPADGAPAGEV
ncbi:MAG: hypothetical protein QOE92_2457 [Chloroflexota bacterium]|jgi:hypothetical protein|nr:hypothetical protein [Chloroflexota bacterium]